MRMMAEVNWESQSPLPFECDRVSYGGGPLGVWGDITNDFLLFIEKLYTSKKIPPCEHDPIDKSSPIVTYGELVRAADTLNLTKYLISTDPRGDIAIWLGTDQFGVNTAAQNLPVILIISPGGFGVTIYPLV